MARAKVTIHDIQKAKEDKRKLVMITAYDYPFGLMADEAEVDIVLVGDSLGKRLVGWIERRVNRQTGGRQVSRGQIDRREEGF